MGKILTDDEIELTVEEAAALIGCQSSHVRLLCRRGTLAGRIRSGIWMIDRQSAEEYRDRPRGSGKPRTNDPRPPTDRELSGAVQRRRDRRAQKRAAGRV